ncbi:MAG: succinyl-diaminopimelate desuccinylase [Neisseriaceae bacterium]
MDQQPIELLQALVRIPSITPEDRGCQKLLIKRLERVGFTCKQFNFNKTSNFWAIWGKGSPLFCFAGHTDVVPPGNLSEWSSPPFEPTIRDGYLYGRGVADMKAGLAAAVTAVERFINRQETIRGGIAFLVTSDEEGDGSDGTRKVIEHLKRIGQRIDYCIVAEPTAIKTVGDTIKNGRRGSLSGYLTVRGKQGHIAYPQLAINPIHKLLPALNELMTRKWDQGNSYFPATSFQISNINAGAGATNVIPGEISVSFNFRFGTASTALGLQRQVEQILDQYQLEYKLDWDISGEPFCTPAGSLLQVAKHVIWEQLGIKVDVNTSGGTSDGRFLKEITDQLIELGVVNDTIHQVNERIPLEEVLALSIIYEKMLTLLLCN